MKRSRIATTCWVAPLLTLSLFSDVEGREPYRVAVQWKKGTRADPVMEGRFKEALRDYAHIRVVANEDEVETIVKAWGWQVTDAYKRSSRVEMGELEASAFVMELTTQTRADGGVTFAGKVYDLKAGDVSDVTALTSAGETAVRRLAHEVCRLLPPHAEVAAWRSRHLHQVTVTTGTRSGARAGQKLEKWTGGQVIARLSLTNVRGPDLSEAEIEFGHERISVGDDLVAVIPEVPEDQAARLTIVVPTSAGEVNVSVGGKGRGQTEAGRLDVLLWPGEHLLEVGGSGAFQKALRLSTGPHTEVVNSGLVVRCPTGATVEITEFGHESWRKLGGANQRYDLGAGRYEIRVTAAERLPLRETVEVSLGQVRTVHVDLLSARGMTRVEGGQFEMGHESDATNPPHMVLLSPYYLDRREVSVEEFRRHDPAYSPPIDNYPESAPAIGVSWAGAQSYCAAQMKRLPTEAEWERACRGPRGLKYGYGPVFDARKTDARMPSEAVAQYPLSSLHENEWGFSNMTGGVWEWCADAYADDPSVLSYENPTNEENRGFRVARGGAWKMRNPTQHASCVYRLKLDPGKTTLGFRCAADAK